MKGNSKYFGLIEDYLEDKLSADDRYKFVEELTKNELLQKEVTKHQIAYSIIERGIEESLRKKLNELRKKEITSDKSYKSNYSKLITLGITIVLVILLIFLISRAFF